MIPPILNGMDFACKNTLTALCLVYPAALAQPPAGYQQVWNDEFDGTQLDGARWEAMSGVRRDAVMDPQDAYLDGNGGLVIRTRKTGDAYHNGFIRTRGRYEPTFGYFEARVRLPKLTGHWAAFWLHGNQVCAGCPGVEVDIMEYFQRGNTIVQNLHWDGYGSEHKSVGSGNKAFPGSAADYHVFAVDWTPQAYIFYIDGKESWRSSAKVSQVPGYIKLTDEVGDWAGNIAEAALPDYFLVDYVRVYQKNASAIRLRAPGERRENAPAGVGIFPVVLRIDARGRLLRDGPSFPRASISYPSAKRF